MDTYNSSEKIQRAIRGLLTLLALPLGLMMAVSLVDAGRRATDSEYVSLASPRYVATTGTDSSNDCTNSNTPCATLQHVVDIASPGDEIRVAAGNYTDIQVREGITQAVYISKAVTVRGGYTTTNWTTSDPAANPTTLDAQGQGRVFYITGDINPTVENLHITGGQSPSLDITSGGDVNGGGIYVITSTVVLSGCQIYGNTAGSGGGVYLTGSSATLRGNTIVSNVTRGFATFGGGVYLSDSPATLRGNTISGNIASSMFSGGGGGVYLSNSSATLNDNVISDNVADEGGGVYLSGTGVMLRGNILQGNRATGVYGLGGGVYVGSSNTTLSGNIILSNTADMDGGGVYGIATIMNGNTIRGNAAGGNGGGVYWGGGTMSGNIISGNTAQQSGGGIYIQSGPAGLIGNVISHNTAPFGGGLGLSYSDATLTNNVIVDNQASTSGSGLYLANSSPRMLHMTIARNSSGDGIGVYIGDYSTVALTNTILVSQTVGITATSEAVVVVNGVLWFGNGANTGGAGGITVTNAITGDPAFAPDGYHLTASSSAVDHGVIAGVISDIDGDVRPFGPAPDLGADEYRVPVALTDVTISGPDTGAANTAYTFVAAVSPFTASLPVTYVWQATGQSVVTHTSGLTDVASFAWSTYGTQAITVTATDELGTATNTHVISIVPCYARVSSTPNITYTSVQTAVDVASDGDTVKVAGICAGVQARAGVTQTVYVSKSLTLRGGYSVNDWSVSDPAANPTILDARGQGRVFYITGNISPTLEGLHITGSSDSGVYIVTATATLSGCQIYGNTGGLGGGVYLSSSSSTLRGNLIAGNNGSGVAMWSSKATLSENTISSNTGGLSGGGVALYFGSDADLTGNTIISNTATAGGGGVYADRNNATLSNNTIQGNAANYFGGGVYLSGGANILDSNAILSNTAGLYDGGGVLLGSTAGTLVHNTIQGNTAQGNGGGIAGVSSLAVTATLSGNTIRDNVAQGDGGGVYLTNRVIMNDNRIFYNEAMSNGGGGYLRTASNLTNNAITDNRAGARGSGLYVSSSPRLLHTTIARNEGGDGSGVYVAFTVWLTNTVIVSQTIGVSATTGSTVVANGVLWFGNGANIGGAGGITITNAITGNPAFAADGYHITTGSAAIDKGVNAGVTTDIDGQIRPLGAAPDLGADEFMALDKRVYLPIVVK